MEKRKMTKAEAFEYLKGKKMRCYDFNKMKEVQHFAISLGYDWGGQIDDVCFVTTLGFEENGQLCFYLTEDCYNLNKFQELDADDILSMEIVEENRSEDELVEIVELGKKIQSLLPKLSGHRHVVITEDDIILREEGMCLFHSDPF